MVQKGQKLVHIEQTGSKKGPKFQKWCLFIKEMAILSKNGQILSFGLGFSMKRVKSGPKRSKAGSDRANSVQNGFRGPKRSKTGSNRVQRSKNGVFL